MTTSQVCLYGGMPVLYMIVPVAVQVLMIGSMGSVVASTFTIASLVVGWSVRMFERFCLDGWHPMNAILRLQPRTIRNWRQQRVCCLVHGTT